MVVNHLTMAKEGLRVMDDGGGMDWEVDAYTRSLGESVNPLSRRGQAMYLSGLGVSTK